MLVRELIAQLQGLDENAEVRLAQQPSWPFEYDIDDVVQVDPPRVVTREAFGAMDEDAQERTMADADEDRVVLLDEGQEAPESIVYIGEGTQLRYLPGGARDALNWHR